MYKTLNQNYNDKSLNLKINFIMEIKTLLLIIIIIITKNK